MDEAVTIPSWIGLPGGHHTLGLARHWHFLSVLFWICNGLVYVGLLFSTNNWGRLIPTSPQILPEAWHTLMIYLSFHTPPLSAFHPYDALQQLAYAGLIFIVTPMTIFTGLALSPAISAQFPWYPRLFGGRQKARSFHFLCMAAYLAFIVIHVSLVFLIYFSRNINHITLGQDQGHETLAMGIGAGILIIVLLLNWLATAWSQQAPRQVQHWTGLLAQLLDFGLSGLRSRQDYTKEDISPYFWVNGRPPEEQAWRELVLHHFTDWRLEVNGLVENPLNLSLADLRAMPHQEQITEHVCIQGWSGIAEWAGVPLSEIILQCRPKAMAKYLVFHSYQRDERGVAYYSTLSLEEAFSPQTILAYEMNGKPLPLLHGAPLRLRVETKLGFKMTKWLRAIELVESYRHIGLGQGGYREDSQYYAIGAEI